MTTVSHTMDALILSQKETERSHDNDRLARSTLTVRKHARVNTGKVRTRLETGDRKRREKMSTSTGKHRVDRIRHPVNSPAELARVVAQTCHVPVHGRCHRCNLKHGHGLDALHN